MGSITEKLQAIIDSKEDIRASIINKGVDVPESTKFSDYPTKISSIPTEKIEAPENDVNFYDYDGFRIASYTIRDAQSYFEDFDTFRIDNMPTHTGLTFDGWNWDTMDLAKTSRKYADIGALYKTTDNATHIKVLINNPSIDILNTGLRLGAKISLNVDYGDGTVETKENTSTSATNVIINHTFPSAGFYDVKISITSNPNSTRYGFASTTSYGYRNYVIKEINIGNNVLLDQSYSLAYLDCKISFPSSVLITATYCFSYSTIPIVNLPVSSFTTSYMFYYFNGNISLPSSCESFSGTYFSQYSSIKRVIVPNTINTSSVGNTLFNNNRHLEVLSLPLGVTFNTSANTVQNCTYLKEFDVEDGWVPTQNITLSVSSVLKVDGMVRLFNNLGNTRTAITITLGRTNTGRLTSDQIAIATNKGYTIA